MKKYYKPLIILSLLGIMIFADSCVARDCRGRRKTAKTAMGGWL
ncbi:MAG: hypothetical protein ACK452_12660 [Bacteroidota bacterium]|jgi:hypothetical protein